MLPYYTFCFLLICIYPTLSFLVLPHPSISLYHTSYAWRGTIYALKHTYIEHWNYVGNVRDLGGAVAISITKFVDPNSRKYMAVIRTRTGDTRLLLQAKSNKLKDLYAALLRAVSIM